MNRRITPLALALLCSLLLQVATAQAQNRGVPPLSGPPAGPFVPPRVSPYLNLLGTNNAAVNYYLRVLPDIDQRARNFQLESAIQNLEQRGVGPTGSELEQMLRGLRLSEPLEGTGHAVRFADNTGYFPAQRGAAGRR